MSAVSVKPCPPCLLAVLFDVGRENNSASAQSGSARQLCVLPVLWRETVLCPSVALSSAVPTVSFSCASRWWAYDNFASVLSGRTRRLCAQVPRLARADWPGPGNNEGFGLRPVEPDEVI